MAGDDFINSANAVYIDRLYAQYQTAPETLAAPWRAFFAGFEFGQEPPTTASRAAEEALTQPPGAGTKSASALVHAYREVGHCLAQLDPLGQHRATQPLLEPAEFGFSAADLDSYVGTGGFLGATDGTLGDLLAKLRLTYCQTLAVEYMDTVEKRQRTWLQQHIEPCLNRPTLTPTARRHILARLVAAATFEHFLHTRYVGHKRFSLEGAEALIPLLDTLVEEGAALGVTEMVMGMAHRGRLNVLAQVLRKPLAMILSEFEQTLVPQNSEVDGDVKYHLGFSHDYVTAGGQSIHLSLSPNPSHLELVNPVIEGLVYAKQQARQDTARQHIVPVLIHGDAAFTGQGIVAETLHLCALEGYRTGGTIHIILNNQIGFTTPPQQLRRTLYPTDVAKVLRSPILHVNADDPEAVVHAARLAMAFRQEFKADVLLDLWCYRRHGHNETDDPTFTQPLMYQKIAAQAPVAQLYAQRLVEQGTVAPDEAESMAKIVRQQLEAAHAEARRQPQQQYISTLGGRWAGLERAGHDWSARTAVPMEVLRQVSEAATRVPPGFTIHTKLPRLLTARRDMGQGKRPLDWGGAEMLAIGSLLLEGMPVRLVGQDSERGTFSHRHAVWFDVKTGERYVPLAHLAATQAPFTILNTMLSELAVLGFEYGVSAADPWQLVLWEAQFGDFVNGAQPIIDQFLASAEAKWQRMSGLVLLLPHGYEGQGPEHSSARPERFLQLCAEQNMQVCCPTTPAQYFHVLRRQMRRSFRKPLVLLTPKSLLRHERSTSALAELTAGSFLPVLDDTADVAANQVTRILLCTGKIYFDLLAAREAHYGDTVALVRVEQLYPFPEAELLDVLRRYQQADEVYWVQEEPRNMGAWSFMEPRLRQLLPASQPVAYCGRDEEASPATGFYQRHLHEQAAIIEAALVQTPSTVSAAVPAGYRHTEPDVKEHNHGRQC